MIVRCTRKRTERLLRTIVFFVQSHFTYLAREIDSRLLRSLHSSFIVFHFIIKSCNNLALILILVCVRLGNLDLDFEKQFSEFAIKCEVQEPFSPPRIGFEGGLQL